MQSKDLQALLLHVMPQWYCHIAKPFKHRMEKGFTPDMYFCIRFLQEMGEKNSMTLLAQRMHMSKQQMTKLVDNLMEQHFVKRASDKTDRRIIRLRVTEEAEAYVGQIAQEDAAHFRELYARIAPQDRARFMDALRTIGDVLATLPPEDNQKGNRKHD